MSRGSRTGQTVGRPFRIDTVPNRSAPCRFDPLLAHDDASVLRALHLFLEVAGFKVETFSSAEEFLVSPCLERARCLVLDVQLGGMSGFELSDCLAATQHQIPLIFITAHDDAQTRERARRAGAV